MGDPLIRTKLHQPFIRQGLVSRPRLQDQISQGLCGPLTLITAPAGFGKTTLVALSVPACGIPVTWLTLDKDDNQVGRFLRYLVAALQEVDQTIGGEAAYLLAAALESAPEAFLTSVINDLDATGREIALVLDDYQVITNAVIHDGVAFLLDHCPKTLHLVIATRLDPPLPLSRMRARGQTVELRAADLRFTESEALQFLNEVMELHLDSRATALLEERTEGWIAGLQMAALSMRGRGDRDSFIREFAGTNRFIMDFMLEEVLSREPEEVQAFLLQTSILNRLSGPLCDAVTGSIGGQMMLEQLERRNLFVVALDSDRCWYRYHHLFSDLLQSRLRQSGPARVAQLLSRAAVWCERDGQIAEAVRYAFAAQDYDRVTSLIERYWQPFTNNGEIETVSSWLNALPENIVKKSLSLSTTFCMVLWLTGQVGEIEQHLIDAQRVLDEQGLAQDTDTGAAIPMAELPTVMAAMRSFVARYHGDYQAACDMAILAVHLMEDLPSPLNEQLRSLAFLALGSAYDGMGDLEKAVSAYVETVRGSRLTANASGVAGITFRMIGALRQLGRLRAADEACHTALAYLQAQGMTRLPAAGILHVSMSELLVERNDLAAAEAQLTQGIALGKWSGRLDARKNAAFVLSRLRQAQQDTAGALAAIQEAEAAHVEPVAAQVRAELLAYRARILLRQGAVHEAARCVETASRLAGRDQGQTRSVVVLAESRVILAQRNPEEAAALLLQSLADAEASGRLGVAIELLILRSLALARLGNDQEALANLDRALSLAAPENYARIFIDEGQPVQVLIAQWLAHAGPGALREYGIHLLDQFNHEPRAPQAAAAETAVAETAEHNASPNNSLVEPLSERELEVLQLMALGRTNEAIARQLVVARGTIKAHAASIYRKLDVSNRTEAVARARQLGILR